MAWVTTKDGRRVDTDWFDKDKQIADNKKEADDRNKQQIDQTIASKFSKKVQSTITHAEKDIDGYHVVVNSKEYGEASFHDKNFSNMKWEINEFLKDGSRF